MTLSGCGPTVSVWRHDATLVIDRLRMEGAGQIFPEEFTSAQEAMVAAEALFRDGDNEEADTYFLLAWTKGQVVEQKLQERMRHEEDQRRRLEAERAQALQRLKEQQEAELQKREREKAAENETRLAEARKKQEKPRPVKERIPPLPAYHTAKRGETLPLIAAQADVYNDPNLWPLLYRANRDQIKDPRQIWPGQVLRIPRNLSREDIAEARRYALDRPIH